ncbi:MAG: hypothetical protein WC477_06385 [Patescibacteria group bacterium]
MNWLIVTWFLAFGYVPEQVESVRGVSLEIPNEYAITNTQVGIAMTAFDRFCVFADIETFQFLDIQGNYTGGAFSPYRADYTIGAEFYFSDNIKIIASHECDHMVSLRASDGYDSSETKVMIRINGKTEF